MSLYTAVPKQEFSFSAYSVSEQKSDSDSDQKQNDSGRLLSPSRSPWATGTWQHFPLIPFLALGLTTVSAIVMIVVLAYSNNRSADWRIAPSVLLAIAAALANLSLRYALNEGVVISWWTKALKPGTKLRDLHQTWASGTYLNDALLAGAAFNLVALSSIVVSLAPVNGVLLQRASSITTTTQFQPFAPLIPIAQEFPIGYTGLVTTRGSQVDILTANFSTIVNQYNRKIPHNLTESTCKGQCSGVLQAAGYAINCNSYTTKFDMTQQSHPGDGNINGPVFFDTHFNFSRVDPITSKPAESLNFTSVVKEGPGCAGLLRVSNCTLVPALLKQHILLTNKTISLDPAYTYADDTVVKLAPANGGGRQSTHGGLALFLSTRYDSVLWTRFDGVYGLEFLRATGSSQLEYMVQGHDTDTRGCNISWSDPTADMLGTARDLAFRIALKAGDPKNATNVQVLTDGRQAEPVLVYTSKFLFLGLALFVTLFGVLCVLPMFYGWSVLGRNVSLSPLEIAKAFDAKRLQGVNSNAEVSELLKEAGERSVRYGVAVASSLENREGTEHGVLMMGDADEVVVPSKGDVYGG